MNKKGIITDVGFFMILLFMFGVAILIGSKVIHSINTNIQDTDMSQKSKDIMNDNSERFVNIFDYLFLTVFVLLMLAVFAGVFLLNTHPAFYFIVVILLAFMLIPLGIISNSFESFADAPSLEAESSQFTITNFIFSKYVLMIGGLSFIGLALLYGKYKSGY